MLNSLIVCDDRNEVNHEERFNGLIMKRDTVSEANRSYLLSQVDASRKENHLPMDNLDLGSTVMSELAILEVSVEAKKMQFKKHCKKSLIKLIKK